MSNTLPIAAIVGLVAGGVGAVATTALRSPTPPDVTSQAENDTAILASLNDIGARLTAMDERIEMLETESELAPIAGGAVPIRSAAAAPQYSEEDLKEIVSSVLKDERNAIPITDELVNAAIERRDERRREEREERQAAEAEKRLEDKLGKMQSELGLDMNQVASLRTVYQEQDVKRREMWSAMRDGDLAMNREEMRDSRRTMREGLTESIQGVLTAGQFQLYEENGYDDFGGRWGGRGGGGRGGGGQGGGGRRGGGN